MRYPSFIYNSLVVFSVLVATVSVCTGDSVDRAAIAAHQDQLQNLVIQCDETRTYNIDPAVAEKAPPHFRQPQLDLKREETGSLTFAFLNGNAFYDRELDESTLKYWAAKGLPAIARQIQTISVTGRIEELTMQKLQSRHIAYFGGIRQFSGFSPESTIDIAIGLRVLGGHQWLMKQDFDQMQETQQADSSIVVLRWSEGDGHLHELHFDRRLLYALVYYRCTNSHSDNVEIRNSDFARYGSLFLPRKIVRISNIIDSAGQLRHPLGFTLNVKHVFVNDPENSATRYAIAWPAHLQLFDARTNDRVEVGPTTRPISDEDIRRQLADRQIQELILENMAAERISHALHQEPTTKP